MTYTKEITMPKTTQDGLANAIQMAINHIEAGNTQEAIYRLVDLIDDVTSKSNPYRISAPAKRKTKKAFEYRGDVNVD